MEIFELANVESIHVDITWGHKAWDLQLHNMDLIVFNLGMIYIKG